MTSDSSASPCSGNCSNGSTLREAMNARQALLPRRNFVKTICLISAGSWLGGKELRSLLVADLHAQSSSQLGIFRVNLDLATFAALKNELGSVRTKVTGMPASFRDIIITREGDHFHAVSSRCTHQGTTVNTYNATIGALRCPQHGSLFNPDGTVISGLARLPLDSYNTSFDGQSTVTVEIPGLGFEITTAAVLHPTTGASRLRIEFPSVTGVRYGVRFRPSLLTGDWTAIPFATAIDGAATTNEITGNNTRKSVFVDRTEQLGFYAVTRTS